MNNVLCTFVFIEFVIGFGFTLWFAMKKIVFPAIDFIVEYFSSYEEFRKWRKRNA